MNFIISANTDIGLVKETNQDSLSVVSISTLSGPMAFAILCDGMGGLSDGEVASGTVVNAFRNWAENSLPNLCNGELEDHVIRQQWVSLVREQNDKIKQYGDNAGVRMGTTAVIMLLTQTRYYILNVGDSRAYEIDDYSMRQITNDHTFVAMEVAMGHMTEEEARVDPRRNVLIQSVGSTESVSPEMFFGEVRQDTVYMLCSDGFRHEISEQEINRAFAPSSLTSFDDMKQAGESLIGLNKERMERDNISVVLVRTY